MRQGRQLTLPLPEQVPLRPDDVDYLRLHWAVSEPVVNLATYLHANRFELQAGSAYLYETDDVSIRGAFDARRTTLQRAITGHPTQVVYRTVNKNFATGPNQVLAWVLANASRYATQWAGKLAGEARPTIRDAVQLLTDVRRINLVREALTFQIPTHPSPQALQQAQTSRRQVYRLAAEAYINLLAIERGDDDIVRRLLEKTLIQPQKDYQVLELAMAVSLAQLAGKHLNVPVHLEELKPGASHVLLAVGDYRISWQAQTKGYTKPIPEPSEVAYHQLLQQFHLRLPTDRPDIIIWRASDEQIVAIGEAKSFGAKKVDKWRKPLRDALWQLVRYARGYRPAGHLDDLLAQSCIALSYYPTADRVSPAPTQGPTVVDANDLLLGHLQDWFDRILAAS